MEKEVKIKQDLAVYVTRKVIAISKRLFVNKNGKINAVFQVNNFQDIGMDGSADTDNSVEAN